MSLYLTDENSMTLIIHNVNAILMPIRMNKTSINKNKHFFLQPSTGIRNWVNLYEFVLEVILFENIFPILFALFDLYFSAVAAASN